MNEEIAWLRRFIEAQDTGRHTGLLLEVYDAFCREHDLPLRDAADNLYHLIY